MSRKKREPARYEGGQDEENEFDQIDGGDLSKNGDEELSGSAETKEGDAISAPAKTRERRKAPSVDEAAKMVRLMSYEDRAAVISGIRSDLAKDIESEHEQEEKAIEERKQRVARLNGLKTGL